MAALHPFFSNLFSSRYAEKSAFFTGRIANPGPGQTQCVESPRVPQGKYWLVRDLSVAYPGAGAANFNLYLFPKEANFPPDYTTLGAGGRGTTEPLKVQIAAMDATGAGVSDWTALQAAVRNAGGGGFPVIVGDCAVLIPKGRLLMPSQSYLAVIPTTVVGGTVIPTLAFKYTEYPEGVSPHISEIP